MTRAAPAGGLIRPERRVDAFVVCTPGLEALVLAEVVKLGVRPARIVRGGVECTVTWAQLWAINLWSRVATRVLVRVTRFKADGFDTLRRRLDAVAWDDWLPAADGPLGALQVNSTCDRGSKLYHTDAVSERVAEALGRPMSTGGGDDAELDEDGNEDGHQDGHQDGTDNVATHAVPGAVGGVSARVVQPELPAQRVMVRVLADVVTVSLDASGDSLHRRGYRGAAGKAPLRETLAAALVAASGWDRAKPLIDPFCGSGTIAIEAAHAARRIAPGRQRTFAFQQWPTYDAAGWARQVDTADSNVLTRCPVIVASDRDEGAVGAAAANAESAGVADNVVIHRRSISDLPSTIDEVGRAGWVVTNPPYGHRVGGNDVRNLYDQFAKVIGLADQWNIAMLATAETPTNRLRAQLDTVLTTSNGGLPVRVLLRPPTP